VDHHWPFYSDVTVDCFSRRAAYPGAVIDPEAGWRTERLNAEPLTVAHSLELAAALDDPELHEFTGGSPLSATAMAQRNARLATRRSADGTQVWANWVLRLRDTGEAIGTLQATLPAAGPAVDPAADPATGAAGAAGAVGAVGVAEVAWVVARSAQGRGYASEAAAWLVSRLRQAGWTVVAHIHPDHAASQRVAAAAGMSPTDRVVDGEVRWITPTGDLDQRG
jgi:RimJ/RimL family protein N-acetyltransferase